MMEERIAQLEALCQAASEGPWSWIEPDRGELWSIEPDICKFGIEANYYPVAGEAPTEDDARFITEARTALPELLAEVRRLREEKSRLWAFVDEVAEMAERDNTVDIFIQELRRGVSR